MTDSTATALIGGAVGILQAIIILFLVGIKSDIQEIWGRIYDHYHEVECGNKDCARLKTGNVIVPGAKH